MDPEVAGVYGTDLQSRGDGIVVTHKSTKLLGRISHRSIALTVRSADINMFIRR